MTTLLGDAPGGAALIDSLTDAVRTLALLYANTPDARALPHLQSYIDAIEPSLVEAVGPDKAQVILNALRRAVMGYKHELESKGGGNA
jgi:hypothetical protein